MMNGALQAFPTSLANTELVPKIQTLLEPYGYGESTLLATSLCCDEVNRSLEHDLETVYGPNFSMGGLAGFPFGGLTSFGAMAHHIPTNGSCLIVFGPHVGVDSHGTVGAIHRRGRTTPGACCGSACAALSHFQQDKVECVVPTDPLNYQQAMVVKFLEPYAKNLTMSSEPMKQLPFCLFDAMRKFMDQIVAAGCREVNNGNIALLGGIQINTDEHEPDRFLPLMFELRNSNNEVLADLTPHLLTNVEFSLHGQ